MRNLGSAWLEIDLDAIASNVRAFKELVSEKTKVMGIVKGNALGHAANSAATLELPHMHLDMVRTGISIFGLYPSLEVKRTIKLISALKFKTLMIYLKNVPAGKSIGYGRTYTTSRFC